MRNIRRKLGGCSGGGCGGGVSRKRRKWKRREWKMERRRRSKKSSRWSTKAKRELEIIRRRSVNGREDGKRRGRRNKSR